VITSTRVLLGGYYVALAPTFAAGFEHPRHFDFSHWGQFLSRTNTLALALIGSIGVSLVAVIIPNNRFLVLTAATINIFYAVGGIALIVWLLLLPGFQGWSAAEDPILILGLVFVPGVAAVCFYRTYRGIRLTCI
jgi:hypothetical protein